MSRVVAGRSRIILAFLISCLGFAAVISPSIAQAEDTVWFCKPGEADDLCNEPTTIDGQTLPPPGEAPQPLGYNRPDEASIDCFYLYPTQSPQEGENANLEKDPALKRAVVQQARMFSTVCDVYAPVYRQVTNNGDQSSHNESVEIAYRSARSAFRDFLDLNGKRGFMMLGHSQGSAHTARLIDEMVDENRKLRKRFVGAIAPGANIAVPIGEAVGGLFEKVPACTEVGEFGCVTAFSTYNADPGPDARFSRVDTGYWIYPEPRFDAAEFEVMCTSPAFLDGDGDDVSLLPLVNFDYLLGAPPSETPAPWRGQPEYYNAECMRQGGSHWLNLSKENLPGDTRPDLGAAVADGSNYHVPEVNLTEANLLKIAGLQNESFQAARLASLRAKLARAEARLSAYKEKIERLRQELRDAEEGAEKKALERKLERVRSRARAKRGRIDSLEKRIAEIERS